MAILDQQFKTIHGKLETLLKQYAQLQKDNEILTAEVANLTAKNAAQQLLVDQLSMQVDILKVVAGNMDEKEKKNFDKQIGQYLKEIDKCIALLSE
jgi:ABC-type iron transport system FetAB ATPase subunit